MTFYELNSLSIIEARINKILERKEKLSEKVLAKKVMDYRSPKTFVTDSAIERQVDSDLKRLEGFIAI